MTKEDLVQHNRTSWEERSREGAQDWHVEKNMDVVMDRMRDEDGEFMRLFCEEW